MSHSFRNTCVRAFITCNVLLASQGAMADVKPDAGDYTGLPPGTDLLVMYYQNPRADDVYVKDNRVNNNPIGLRLDVGILRYVHFVKWGDYIIDPQVIMPFGRQRVDGAPSNSGLGDIIFGGTLWTKADLKTGEHLGFSLFVTAPTGSDKNQGFALSNDRWALDLQSGYIRKLADKWTMDLVAEVEFYGEQRTSNVKTDPLLQGHAHLRYHFSDATHVALSYRHAWGAETELYGVKNGDRKNNDNATLTWASFIAKQWQLQLQYTQDLHVENGPKLDGVQARLLYAF